MVLLPMFRAKSLENIRYVLMAGLAAVLVLVMVPASGFAAQGTWSSAAPMATAREYQTATLLSNGKVLVTGGIGNPLAPLGTAELYDPIANSWSSAGTMSAKRAWHTATLLDNGQVLVTGGSTQFAPISALATAEIYDPGTNSWITVKPMSAARAFHTASLLSDGNVLVAGGETTQTGIATAEIYNPTTNSWATTGSLQDGRFNYAASLLVSGQVLATGGLSSVGVLPTLAESYDPSSGRWSAAGSLLMGRYAHTATLLNSGDVLVAGGYTGSAQLAEVELYNPSGNSWTAAGSLALARTGHTATLLPSGGVLVAGGGFGTPATATAEYYDTTAGQWFSAGAMSVARENHSATLLPSGKVLVAGGTGASGELASAEVFGPTPAPVAGAGFQAIAYDSTANAVSLNLSGGVATSVSVSVPPSHGTATATGTGIAYTPTAGYAGPDNFAYTAMNAGGFSSQANISLTVTAPTLAVAPATLPVAELGVAYDQTVTGTGGMAPYHFAISAGALPAGLALSASTGVISGTPTTGGASSFTVMATDSSTGNGPFTATHAYSVTVETLPPTASSVSVTTPCNGPAAINLANAIVGGDITAVTVATAPRHGSAIAHGEVIAYTPTTGYCGASDSFTYTATNPIGTSAPATVTVTIGPQLNLAPAANAYVANFGDNSVSVINTAYGTVTATIAVGTGPDAVVPTPDGSKAYVANFTANTVSVIATASNTVAATIPVGTAPFGLAISPDGARVYVANSGAGSVSVISTATNTVTNTVPVGLGSIPFGVTISPDGSKIYVADSGSGALSVIDAATVTAGSPIALGKPTQTGPYAVALSLDGGTAYVTNNLGASVSVVGIADGTILATVPVGPNPTELALSPDGTKLYVANSNALANPPSGTVSVISTATNKVTATIPVGLSPDGVAVTPDGSQIYLADVAGNGVSVISAASNAVTKTIPVGTSPHGRGIFIGPAPTSLAASILPGGRSVQLGTKPTVFATILNTAAQVVEGCQIALPPGAPAGLSLAYQTTNPATNALIGQPNTPGPIAGKGSQTYVLTFNATAALAVSEQPLDFLCDGVLPAPVTPGVNTIDLTISATPVPDIVALAATSSNDGTIHVPTGGIAAFAVATVNLGATASLTASADTGAEILPVVVTLCQTTPSTGQCLAPPAATVSYTATANATPTFSIFVAANEAVAFAPGVSRVFVRFKDAGAAAHGSTSVAVEAQ
jgi:YVTN family beta-propeller protein